MEEGKIKPKASPLKVFGLTCIGKECCDVDMLYDATRNKCYKYVPPAATSGATSGTTSGG